MLQRVHAGEEDSEGQGWKQDVQPRRNKEGRSWGDYGGQYCAECPYFIHDKFMGKWERELLRELEKQLKG